jgi:5-methylcytosine-specific restriction endonuclease McrA
MSIKKRTLLLNADFLPFSVLSWQRAIVLKHINDDIPEEGVTIIENYPGLTIRSGGGAEHSVPAIAKLARYVQRNGKKVPFSRRNVFIRDRLTCQYCMKKFLPTDLTYDHVISRFEWKKKGLRGTPTRWDNIVTACKPCNLYKGNNPLDRCGMTLRKRPEVPDPHLFVSGLIPWGRDVPEIWKPYLIPIYKDLIK